MSNNLSDPRAHAPARHDNEVATHVGHLNRVFAATVSNIGNAEHIAATTVTNIAPDSGLFIAGAELFIADNRKFVVVTIGMSLKTLAWGTATELMADNVLPTWMAPMPAEASFNTIGIHTTSKTAHIFNITFGGPTNPRRVRVFAQLGPQILPGLEDSVTNQLIGHVDNTAEFEFAGVTAPVLIGSLPPITLELGV